MSIGVINFATPMRVEAERVFVWNKYKKGEPGIWSEVRLKNHFEDLSFCETLSPFRLSSNNEPLK